MLRALLAIPCRVFNSIVFNIKHVKMNNADIRGFVHLHGKGKIIIGKNLKINSSQDSNPSSGGLRTHISVGEGAQLIIGDNVGISNSAITVTKHVEIQNNVMIGSCCMITDTDFHSIFIEDRVNGNINAVVKPVKICEGAFIGARSIILKGVTIGRNSVIGAGSVVTKSVPCNQVWAGNPAKFIKDINNNVLEPNNY